ncbi:hypothetical protein BBJ28_00025444 [Nothophytophthora sp. Chile5]|nr:hypothetical protein BBJ28_00025444 [Nothophytophthora sp. Chile5]
METKPPIFEGDIDGVKLNSFTFQFESYFTFKGYDLALDDTIIGRELGQCGRKSAATWYETYVMNPTTITTWSAMKVSLEKNFKEPNFQQKMRNELLNFKQRGSYQGYIAKFLEKLRLVPLDPVFAKENFLKGLSSNNIRKQILRKKPETLDDVIAESFSEVEIERLDGSKAAEPDGEPSVKPNSTANKGFNGNKNRQQTGKANGQKKAKCPHCERGFYEVNECWVKYPEKRPKHLDHGPRGRNAKQNGTEKTDYKAKYFALK